MVIDNLLAVELVTADGQQLRASATEHPDLFWALRGGSGNFGIATSYEYHLEPMGQVLGGMLAFPLARAAEIMRLYRDFTAAAPDEITTYLILAAPPQFGPLVVLMLCYSGADLEQGQRVIAPLRAAGPVMDMVRPMSYSEMTHLTDPFAPHGLAREEAWINVRGLSDANLDELLATTTPALAQGATLIVKQLNGKAARVDPLATAFPHRNAPYSIVPLAAWLPGQDPTPHRAWVEQMRETVAPITAGVYVNGADGDSLEAAYGINAIRLAGIKRRYDPDNIFDGAVNIPPRQS
jgi:FAD/FMN-containing dehydrogenase